MGLDAICTRYESIRVALVCKGTFKRCLFRDQESQRELRSLSTNIVELVNEGHGKHRGSRETRDGAHWGREGGKLYPDRIGEEVAARGAGSVRG